MQRKKSRGYEKKNNFVHFEDYKVFECARRFLEFFALNSWNLSPHIYCSLARLEISPFEMAVKNCV